MPKKKKPKHVKVTKFLIYLIPVAILFLIIYQNYLIPQEFHYFLDEKTSYLTPLSRVQEDNNVINLTDQLVYFTANIPTNSKTITIKARIKPNFPNNAKMSIGAKDQDIWHYKYNLIYDPNLNLNQYENNQEVYAIKKPLITKEQLQQENNIIIATDQEFNQTENILENYQNKDFTITTTLRGGHTFYIYAKDNLNIEVQKQDINWYNNSDELNITLYDKNHNQIASTIIEDDGITDVNRDPAIIQTGNLNANVKEGVYILELENFDGIIRQIKLNTDKIVAKRLFLADNELYGIPTKPTNIYSKENNLNFLTYHAQGIQKITYNNQIFDFYQEDYSLDLDLQEETSLTFPENDIIITSTNYITFNKENYFQPFKQIIIPLDQYKDADYALTNYKQPIQDGDFIITQTTFNLDNLYIKNNQLSLLFNTPHLSNEEYKNYTIPVDWIDITVYKPALI